MQQETVHFDSDAGARLAGVLDRPADRIPRSYVLFAHDLAGPGNVEAAIAISKALCGQGAGVLCIDLTGTGRGEGELAGSDHSSSEAYLLAAARFLEREHAAPAILIGHGTAAAAVLRAVGQVSSVRALAVLDAPVDTSWQDTLRTRGCGLLILHSAEAGMAANGAALAVWAAGHMDPVDADGIDYDEPVIARIGERGLRVEMEAGGLPLVADEPRRAGGTASGPTPYGYLSAALASCTAMTLRMYADHKKLDLRGVEVRVNHDRIHADDCEHCETRAGKVDRFRRELRLEGTLDDAQRQRLVEIANRCPVHRTLHAEIEIQTRLLDD